MAERICTIDGCTKKLLARDRCSAHYYHWRRDNSAVPCTVDGCTSPGTSKGLCGRHYQRQWSWGSTDDGDHRRRASACTIEGCDRPGNNRGLCLMHAKRVRRNGTPDTRPVGEAPPLRVGKYQRVFVGKDHPLAHTKGTVWAHRLALFEAIGPGTHPCHWCGTPVRWETRWPAAPDGLCADHIDNNRGNNDPSNLVPSCGPCNVARQPQSA